MFIHVHFFMAGKVTVKFTNGEIREVAKDTCTVQKTRSPIDAWPDSFIFFDRYVMCQKAPLCHILSYRSMPCCIIP
jgi:hypothetical protein